MTSLFMFKVVSCARYKRTYAGGNEEDMAAHAQLRIEQTTEEDSSMEWSVLIGMNSDPFLHDPFS